MSEDKVEFKTLLEAFEYLDKEANVIRDKIQTYNTHVQELVKQVLDNASKSKLTD